MPIRINLLAEAKAEEDARRKDPVKRAILIAIMLLVLMLFWSSILQFKIIIAKSEFNGLEAKWKSMEKTYQEVVEKRRLSLEAQERLAALQRYTTNRFLWGTALNALPPVVGGVADVQVVRLKTEQKFVVSEEAKPQPAPGAPAAPKGAPAGKEATATETISMVIDAVDSSAQPGVANVSQFKTAIANLPFFQGQLSKTNGVKLTSQTPPTSAGPGRKSVVAFTMQCSFTDRIR